MNVLDGPFLKPMLTFSKDELRNYLIARNLTWREDASNQSRKYKRNKVRLDLVPLLEEVVGGQEALQSRLFALAAQSLQVRKMIQSEVSHALAVLSPI